MQNRLGLRYTTLLINCHCQKNGDNAVSRSSVNSAFRRLQKKYRKYNKVWIMRESGKRQGIDKGSNGWSFSPCFQRRNSKCEIKCKDVNIDNNSTHLTFSILFIIYKRDELEISHEPSWYDKEQLPSLTSTQLIFFYEVHIQQVSEPPMTSKFNEHKILQSNLVNLTFYKINTDSTVIYIGWEKRWWYDLSSMGSGIWHTALNAVMMGSISVDVLIWMMLVTLNGEYRIAEESHKNDVG